LNGKAMKNKKPLLIGILITLLFVFFINGILQYFLLKSFGVTVDEITFSGAGLTSFFSIDRENNIYFNTLLIFSKLLISISFLELGILLLSKFSIGNYRFATITSILSLLGYLILTFFYGVLSSLVSETSNSSFSKMLHLLELEGNQNLALMFFLLIIFVGYLHFVQKRVLQYLQS